MGYAPRALLAGALGFAVAFLAACGGGSGLLSSDQANTLNAQLDQVSSAVDAGQCGAAANAVTTLSNAIIDLPPSVSATLTRNLEQGASTVAQLAARDCRNQTSSTTTSSTTTSSTTTTSTPTTTTATTATTTTTSTPTTTTTTTTTTTPTTPTTPTKSIATTQTGSGTTSTNSGSGGAGLGGGSGGSGTGGNGNGQ